MQRNRNIGVEFKSQPNLPRYDRDQFTLVARTAAGEVARVVVVVTIASAGIWR